jgi:hypothetical protein
MKTSHAVVLSSCGLVAGGLVSGKGELFVVGLGGGQAVMEAADEVVEQVALGGDVSLTGGSAAVVVGAGAG